MENKAYDYFYEEENEQYLFLQMPMMLIKEPQFKGLSGDAKIAYSLFLNRTSLSRKNGWKDKEGRVYIIYTIEEIKKDLNCQQEKAIKLIKELREHNLVKTVQQGLGKPNLIYVMNFATELKYKQGNKEEDKKEAETNEEMCESLKFENRTSTEFENQISCNSKIELQGIRKSNPIHINRNQIDPKNQINLINTNPIVQSNSDFYDFADKDIIIQNIYRNINLNNLNLKYSHRENDLSNILNVIRQTVCSDKTSFRIGKKDTPALDVRQALYNLNQLNIEFVFQSLLKHNISDNIKNYNAYILTSLYNASVKNYVHIDVDCVKDTVKNNIALDSLLSRHNDKKNVLLELYDIIVEVLISRRKSFHISKEDMPTDIVKQSFARLTAEHMEYVIDSLQKCTSQVKSTKAYIQTVLFNATKTINNHYSFAAQNFLYETLGIQAK